MKLTIDYRIPGTTGGHYKSQAADSNRGVMESNEEITDAKSRSTSSKAKKKWNPDEDPDVINLDEYAGKKSEKLPANDGQQKYKQDADKKSDKKSALGKGKRSGPHAKASTQVRTRRSQPAPLSTAPDDELEAGEIPAYRVPSQGPIRYHNQGFLITDL
jgi:hypothetical protein